MKRKKVGIVFSNNENWIGGTYYILNLVSALLLLDDAQKPEIVIFSYHDKDFELVKETNYPYLSFLNLNIKYNIFERIVNKFSRMFFKINWINKSYSNKHVDSLFPYGFQPDLKDISNKNYWIPDFQEHHYPDFFLNGEVSNRKQIQSQIADQKNRLILSSNFVKSDFNIIYPNSICETKVVNFAVTHPLYSHLNIDELKRKFGIDRKYFMVPNQFWIHKNHMVVLKAIKLIVEKNEDILIVFTGKEYDYRNPNYTTDLKDFVSEHSLSKNVLFLGFIDRMEQLQLMNHAIAIIQPSFFEGWNTAIEDAKAMNQYVVASNIQVHIEQLHNNVSFFDPQSELELVEILLNLKNREIKKDKNNYQENVKKFAVDFMNAIKTNN